MSPQLLGMDGMIFLNGLEFYDDKFFNQQVSAKSFVEFNAIVFNRDWHLPTHAQAAFLEFMRQSYFINRFQQPRPKRRVQFVSRIHDLTCDLIWSHGCFGLCALCASA
jgi:hypothetical protein